MNSEDTSFLLQYLNQTLSFGEFIVESPASIAHLVWDGNSRVHAAHSQLTIAFKKRGIVATSEIITNLLELMAELSGQEISCSHLLHRMRIAPKEVLKMLGAAELAGLWWHTQSFDHQDKEVVDRSKGYMVDVGLAAELLGVGDPMYLQTHRQWGALFETFVMNRIFSHLPEGAKLFYWRCADGSAEVDAVVVYEGRLYPLEIKSASHASLSNAKKIAVFRQRYESRYFVDLGIVVYAGSRYYQLGDRVLAVPCVLI